MNIIFLSLSNIKSINDRDIYSDVLRKFKNEGHDITIVSPAQRREGVATNIITDEGVTILKVKTLNITKTNVVEKGLATLAIEHQYLSAIKRYFPNKKFDLVLLTTPPITFVKVVEYIKKRDNAKSYLLLKDIFPQNAVDMGMMRQGGVLHKSFVKKEKKLYAVSDMIGCMSQANVDFVLKHNPEVEQSKVEINPNTIEPVVINYTDEQKREVREKYNLPIDKKILVYGGNLGKPQGLNFLLQTISENRNEKAFFLIVGDGTQYKSMREWFDMNKPKNAVLFQRLPKDDYDRLLASCDVGLIFLDKNFLIPNFPSRLLSYLEMRMPVLAATDLNSDVGDVVEKAGCGYKVISGDIATMNQRIDELIERLESGDKMGERAWQLLQDEYLAERSYDTIMRFANNNGARIRK